MLSVVTLYEVTAPGTLRASESRAGFGAAFVVGAVGVCLAPVALRWRASGFDAMLVFPTALGILTLLTGGLLVVHRTDIIVCPSAVRLRRRGARGWSEHVVPSARVACIRVVRDVPRGSRSGRVTYPVELVFDANADLPERFCLSQPRDEATARAEAEHLCRTLGVPFEDALGNQPIRRRPDELDAGAEPLRAPAGPPPAGVTLGPGGTTVHTRGLLPRRRLAILVAAVASSATSTTAVIALVGAAIEGPGRAMAWIGAIGIDAALVLLLIGLAGARETIAVRGGRIRHEILLFGLRLARREIDAPAVEYLRLQTTSAGGVGIVSDGGAQAVGRSLDEDAARWLRAWIGARLRPGSSQRTPVSRAG